MGLLFGVVLAGVLVELHGVSIGFENLVIVHSHYVIPPQELF